MSRKTTIGALIGLFIGILVYFIFPKLLNVDLYFNRATRLLLGYSQDQYFPKNGSIYSVGYFLPIIFGLIGGTIGSLIPKKKAKQVN